MRLEERNGIQGGEVILTGFNIEEKIWNYFRKSGFNEFGTAGIMGNLYCESGLNPKNLQNTFNKRLNMTDDEYTYAVDNGSYTNFVYDSAGYGLAQWTYWSRKQGLLGYVRAHNCSVGDLETQLNYIFKELNEGYQGVVYTLSNAVTVLEASNAILLQFERPADQSEAAQNRRASDGQKFYNKYACKEQKGETVGMSNSPLVNYTKISPNRTSPRRHEIDTITIHCVVGQCTVETLGELFAPVERGGASNYGVGKDGRIGMYVEEKDRAWTSGGKDRYGNPILVNGISGSDNDHRAITIEVASDKIDPFAVTKKAYDALIQLCADICRRNNIKELKWEGDKSLVGQIDRQNMTVHRWFANKACPGDFLYNRHSDIAKHVNNLLNPRINDEKEDENMDVTRFHELWLEMRDTLKDNDSSNWSKEARNWAIDNKLVQGGGNGSGGEPNYMWEDVLTREQLVTVLYRFAQIMGKA